MSSDLSNDSLSNDSPSEARISRLAQLLGVTGSETSASSDTATESSPEVKAETEEPVVPDLAIETDPNMNSDITETGSEAEASQVVPSESSPEAASESSPEAASESSPEAASESSPEAASESSPETTVGTDYSGLLDSELLDYWENLMDVKERDRLIQVMMERNLFPREQEAEWERTTGAYPDIRDPEFLQKLLGRREFAESYQATFKSKQNPCGDAEEFEISPVQRFVANFMSPKTPYQSALLYHGVGVGKTCSAIQIAEQALALFPNKKVIILAPPTIQSGFLRTIFDIDRVRIGTEPGEPNSASQCTGSTYLELTNTLYERKKEKINNKVLNKIRRRYAIYGYVAFANHIRNMLKTVPAGLSEERRLQEEKRLLNRFFSGHVLIIDEAHNLRDVPELPEDADVDTPGGEAEQGDAAAGKLLTPYIRKLLSLTDGMKLIMMTATPMYNTYREIIFLLNLILMNEKQATLSETDIFWPQGKFRENGEALLGAIAQRYISYMRGENPQSFPLRLYPKGVPLVKRYPTVNPRNVPISEGSGYIAHLPIVNVELRGDSLDAQLELMDALPPAGRGAGLISPLQLEPIVQAGTCIVPDAEGLTLKDRVGRTALSHHFHQQTVGGEVVMKAKESGGAEWLARDELADYAPKIAAVLERIQSAEGVCFLYSRFVSMGAIPIALALEANGYTPYGRRMGLLGDGMQTEGGRQCALCPLREDDHDSLPAGVDAHDFTPAYYVLLTGDKTISPKNADSIRAARAPENRDGARIKVIVGSQVAAEGVDLRFVREIHVLESWYHLNKTEQVIGRGIRTCSHGLLPQAKRNCTVYLYAATLPAEMDRESVDLYSYRVAFKKGQLVGAVSRVLKVHAIDCNLNHDAILIAGEPSIQVLDSQRKLRPSVSINDKPYSAICDWMETCDYTCVPDIKVNPLKASEISYDEYTGRWMDAQLRKSLRKLFEVQVFYREEDLWNIFGDIPYMSRASLLSAVVNNPSFRVSNKGREGFIIYRNGYYLFQPFMYQDLNIPIAVRAASIPVRQDSYSPEFMKAVQEQFGAPAAAAAAAPPDAGAGGPGPVAIAAPKVSGETIMRVLRAWEQWAEALAARDLAPLSDITTYIAGQTAGDRKETTRQNERLEMIRWFATSLRNSGMTEEKKGILKRIIVEFAYDEQLGPSDQAALFLDPTTREFGRTVSHEQFLREGKTEVFLNVDLTNGKITYLCTNGEPCSRAIEDLFEGKTSGENDSVKRRRNPNYKLAVDDTTTGRLYGFLAAKRGVQFVFKTNAPPAPGGKVAKGAECANVSNIEDHRNKLIQLGDILLDKTGNNFDLTKTALTTKPREIVNANRICTLMDIVLRYMDALKIKGKRWFYRAVPATASGHKGTFRVNP